MRLHPLSERQKEYHRSLQAKAVLMTIWEFSAGFVYNNSRFFYLFHHLRPSKFRNSGSLTITLNSKHLLCEARHAQRSHRQLDQNMGAQRTLVRSQSVWNVGSLQTWG